MIITEILKLLESYLNTNIGINEFKTNEVTIRYTIEPHRLIHLNSLRTKSKYKNKGFARKAMEEFLELTDQCHFTVKLDASPLTKSTNLGKLVKFYKSLGFSLTGKTINPMGDPEMIRKPLI